MFCVYSFNCAKLTASSSFSAFLTFEILVPSLPANFILSLLLFSYLTVFLLSSSIALAFLFTLSSKLGLAGGFEPLPPPLFGMLAILFSSVLYKAYN